MDKITLNEHDVDTYFTKKLTNDLQNIKEHAIFYENMPKSHLQNIYRESDSPLTISSSGSDDIHINTNDNKINLLNALSIYCKCQKCMYEQSNIVTRYKSNCIYGITISITSGICIFISFLESYQWKIIIIVLNIIVSILLVLIKYLKLETTAEIYLYMSRHFDVVSNNIINNYLTNENNVYAQDINIRIKELTHRITEIKDIYHIIIPIGIKHIYPVGSNIDISLFIKKVNDRISNLNEELIFTNNEIKYILRNYSNNMGAIETNRMNFLVDKKTQIRSELKQVQNAFSYIEEIFTKEINKAQYYRSNICKYFIDATDFRIDHSHCNVYVDDYITFILPQEKK